MVKITAFSLSLLVSINGYASDLFELGKPAIPKQQVQASLNGTMVSLRVAGKSHGGIINISGPNGFHESMAFDGSSATVNLLENFDSLPAGRYTYHITSSVGQKKLIKDTMNNGRGENDFTYAGTPVEHSGGFTVKNGGIQQVPQIKEASNEW